MIALKDEWNEQRRQRQAAVAQRRQQVQDLLATFQEQRQADARQIQDDLSLFRLKLQQDTAKFLGCVTEQRQVQAHELTQTLNASRNELTDIMRGLRKRLQAEVNAIQLEVQARLDSNNQERAQNRVAVAQQLAEFIDSLRADVQTYLSELELMRQDRAQQVQASLSHSRSQRLEDVSVLFQHLASFRTELQAYSASLKLMIWGAPSSQQTNLIPSGAVMEDSSHVPTLRRRSTPAKGFSAKTASAVVPVAQPEVTKDLKPEVALVPAAVAELAPKNLSPLEEDIYDHIQQIHGARLTEIESALSINRFQVVDALRTLIKKGLITQRDRVYLVHEEAM